MLTTDCNNNCIFCLYKTTRSNNKQKQQLTFGRIKELIEQAAELGMTGTYWTGGEPLASFKNLTDLIDYSTERGLFSTIVTNGGLIGAYGNYKILNQHLLEKSGLHNLTSTQIVNTLKKAGLTRIYFSIDSNHTSLQNAFSHIYDSVPVEVVCKAIRLFLEEGYGKKHKLQAIGNQLRISATSSGLWNDSTNQILEKVIKNLNLNLKHEAAHNTKIFGNEKGEVLIKRLQVSNIGAGENLDSKYLEAKAGKDVFDIQCPHFNPKKLAYDNGKYHGDLLVDYNGIVYICGNMTFPVGNIFKESLGSIIEGINTPNLAHEFGMTRKVFYSLLLLSQNEEIGNKAVGSAFRMIYSEKPELILNLKTQCGSCNCLGNNKELQKIFLQAFEKNIICNNKTPAP